MTAKSFNTEDSENTEGYGEKQEQTAKGGTGAERGIGRRRSALLLGVNADIVDEHLLRKNRGGVGRSGPIAANGDVQEDEKRMIEAPSTASGPLGLRKRSVEIRVNVEANGAGFPLNSIKMKIVGKILAGRKAERRGGIARLGHGAGAVERSVDRAGLLADIFHDVDSSLQTRCQILAPASLRRRAVTFSKARVS